MSDPDYSVPRPIGFDRDFASALARLDGATPLHEIQRAPAQPAAFHPYAVTLTARGGFRIDYRDQPANALDGGAAADRNCRRRRLD